MWIKDNQACSASLEYTATQSVSAWISISHHSQGHKTCWWRMCDDVCYLNVCSLTTNTHLCSSLWDVRWCLGHTCSWHLSYHHLMGTEKWWFWVLMFEYWYVLIKQLEKWIWLIIISALINILNHSQWHNAMLIKDSHACSVCLDFQVTPKSSALINLMHNDTKPCW